MDLLNMALSQPCFRKHNSPITSLSWDLKYASIVLLNKKATQHCPVELEIYKRNKNEI